MNKLFFEELQRDNCWFTFAFFEKLPDVDPQTNLLNRDVWQDDTLIQRHIFALIFGSFGYKRNLLKAIRLCYMKISHLAETEPRDTSFNNPEFVRWIGLFAQYYVLVGTAFAYQRDYVSAARYMMNGLKTGAINLCLPYCDFIRYVLSRVEMLPTERCEYEGCGFSPDNPMGSPELDGGTLIASVAEDVIPALEGEDGDIILAYNGMQKYGNMRRLGSVKSNKFKNLIDVYEVLYIDKNGVLKKLRLYFNGYFSNSRGEIRLPDGFRLDPCSQASSFYKKV